MPSSLKAMLAKVKNWNVCNPIGTKVYVQKDLGDVITTETTSEAYMLGASGDHPGHTPVIMTKDISGCYLLDRVRPIQ